MISSTSSPDTGHAARPVVSIIVVSYNTRDLTVACLKSVLAETSGLDYELIVVDNASSDGSPEAIAACAPQARLIVSPTNLGFAAANNLAAKAARGELLLLLNPDTLILDNAVGRLVEFAREKPSAQIWGGRSLLGDRTVDPGSCWRRMTPWSQFCIATGLASAFKTNAMLNVEGYGNWPIDAEREVDIVTGCFLLIRASLWRRLGGFDPLFFMYGEDADLCLRARRLGARPMMTPRATIIHYGGASESVRADKLVRLFKARVTLMQRYWSWPSRRLGPSLFMLQALTRMTAYALARILRPGAKAEERLAAWRAVWSRRNEWLEGFVSLPAAE